MENTSVSEGKTAAIIAYLTIFGTIVAYIMNRSKKNYFTSFHIRQMIGIVLLGLINKYVVYDILGSIAGWILGVFIFILWVIGFIGAIQGEEKEVPVVGEHFQNWFRGI
tara:strand:+ start:12457 stop:12783 length:327 start_codon:yes stop_codon:yes gene_type:complete